MGRLSGARPLLGISFVLLSSLPAWAQQELESQLQPEPAVSPSPDSHLFEQGKLAYANGDFVGAIEALLEALRTTQTAEIYTYLGLSYYNLSTFTLAIDAFESALSLTGGQAEPSLLFSLALSYYYAHDLEHAQELLNQVLNLPETPPELRQQAEEQLLLTLRDQSSAYQQAMSAYQEGRFNDAVQAFQEVLQLVPDSAEIHYYLGLSAYQLLNFELAKRSLQRVIELAPETEYASSAAQTLEVINKLAQGQPRGPFYGSISLGTQGDSNVNFGDAGNNRFSSAQTESALQDLGSVLNLNLNYAFNAVSSLRYNYLFNLYWGLNDNPERQLNSYDYNLQQHSLSLFHRIPINDWIELYLDTRSSMQVLAGEVYLADAEIRPTLTFYETERLITRAYLELAAESYQRFSQRDNLNYALGLDQYLYFWNSQTWLRFGYRFNHVLANDGISKEYFSQNGHLNELEFRSAASRSDNQLAIGFGFPLGPLNCELGTSFNFLLYNQPDIYRLSRIGTNPLTGLPLPPQVQAEAEKFREDTRLNFYLQAEWPLSERWKLLGRYNRLTNISNISPIEFPTVTSRSYLKDVLEVSLRWEF